MKAPEKIFVVDDDAAVRKGLLRLLRSAGHDCETFASAEIFLERPHFEGVGCLLLDLRMPAMTGLELQERLDRLGYVLPIVFLTGHGDIPQSVQAVKRGAVNFLSKPVDDEVLLAAIAEAFTRSRQIWEAGRAKALILQRIALLTPREFEVMQGVIAGTLNKQIGGRLGINEKTVKVHRGQVMRKLEVVSVADLVRLCETAGVKPVA